jgi:hypothetical protein
MEFSSGIDIDAPPSAVWAVLVDVPAWPRWDSGVLEAKGSVANGSKVSVRSLANPKRAFAARVVECNPPRRMVWRGGMPLGLFTGVRTFTLDPVARGTRFDVRETFSGSRMIGRTIPDLGPSLIQFAAGLKARVEAEAPHGSGRSVDA